MGKFNRSNLTAIAIAVCLIVRGQNVRSQPNSESEEPSSSSAYTSRLSRNIVPLNYLLRIRPVLEDNPDFMQWTAPGRVSIEFKVLSETDLVTLHAKNLTILDAEVKLKQVKDGTEVKIKSQMVDGATQTYSIHTEVPLVADETYELFIPFVGSLIGKKEGLVGFAYPDAMPPGGLKMAVLSRFQPYHAREAFPCFDEPHFRAPFEIRIARMEKYQTFSNAPVKDTVPCEIKGWVWDRYEPTPPMSPNLVSVIVVDGYIAQVPANPGTTEVKIWGPVPAIESGGSSYALDLTTKAVEYFREYFHMPFPMPKLDSVLMPKAFGPAIQHWGTIVYSLSGVNILIFPGATPEWKRFNAASLVTHEVLHQWMGNLISADWWSDIWLHEGFAEYFSDLALAHDSPEYQAEITFINSHSQLAFRFDQSGKAHPVKHNFTMMRRRGHAGEEEMDAFDDTIYSKAAALVRMMRYFMTEPVFQEGIRQFFKKFAYHTVTQTDLFESMNGVMPDLPAPMTDIMNTWTLQEGYPVVKVTSATENNVVLVQEPFQSMRGAKTERLWWIPLLVSQEDQPKDAPFKQLWLSTKEQTFEIDSSKWYILNSDAAGYFRVLYDQQNFDRIKAQLDKDHNAFSALTRSQLFDDYFAFAEFGYVPIDQVLSLMSYLDKETELVVWTTVLSHLKYPIQMFSWKADAMGLEKYIKPKIEAVLAMPELMLENALSLKGAPVLLQLELLKFGIILDSDVGSEYSLKAMKAWMETPEKNPIPPDFQIFVYCAGVGAGDKEIWDFVKQMHDSTPPSEQKMYLFRALTCTKDKAVLEGMLEDSWSQSPQMALQTLESFTDSPIARSLVLESLKTNMLKIYAQDFVQILSELAEYYIEPITVAELEKFVEANKDYFMPASRGLQEQLDRIRANGLWVENTGKKIDEWCDAQLASS